MSPQSNISAQFQALVVDDEPPVAGLTARALTAEGFVCDVVNDGRQAKEMQEKITYDVVVTDLRMPDYHGHSLATDILAGDDPPMVIVLTGLVEPKLAKDLIARGVADIEFKPVNHAVFAAKIKARVARRTKNNLAKPGLPASLPNLPPLPHVGREQSNRVPQTGRVQLVEDLMTRELRTVGTTATMREAATVMSTSGVRHLPVVNERLGLVGVITQRDIFRTMGQSLNTDTNVGCTRVTEYMCSELITASPTEPIPEVAAKIVQKRIGCLPVMSADRKLVGMLTRSDLLKGLANAV